MFSCALCVLVLIYFNYNIQCFNWQRDEKIKPTEIDKLYTQLMNTTNSQMNQLQKKVQEQKNAEEQERLRKIQEEMEKEKKRKEEEEKKKREEEENRRKYVYYNASNSW